MHDQTVKFIQDHFKKGLKEPFGAKIDEDLSESSVEADQPPTEEISCDQILESKKPKLKKLS